MAGNGTKRTDRASLLVKASPHAIYRAFVDPDALVEWLPPTGMKGEIFAFEARAGGAFRMALTYEAPDPTRPVPARHRTTPTLSKGASSSWSRTSASCRPSPSRPTIRRLPVR